MKGAFLISGTLSLAALLFGCGQNSSSNDSAKTAPAAPAAAPASASTPTAAAATAPANAPAPVAAPATPATTDSGASSAPVDSTTSAATSPAQDAAAAANDPAVAPMAQFAATAASQTDKVAASVGSDLAAKAKSLAQSAAGNPDLKTKVASALQSLSAGKDGSALGTLFQQAKQANLTPQQTQLVKDVSNLASAYVVQKNFSSLDGAQGNVATIVNSLRNGSVMQAVPALQSLAQNASLTTQQKDLLGTLADQYAPGLKKTSDSLKQGLQSLQGLTK